VGKSIIASILLGEEIPQRDKQWLFIYKLEFNQI
jgi:hypothetical protein